MSEYTQKLALLTDEEQRIRRGPLGRDERARLDRIARARELLWNVERAHRAKRPLSEVPLDGWAVDRGGYAAPRPRRARTPTPPPEETQHLASLNTPRALPKGVERLGSGRVRAVCYLKDRTKISLGTCDATQIALAGRMAAAARDARDKGGSVGQVRAAALTAYQQETQEHSYAAD